MLSVHSRGEDIPNFNRKSQSSFPERHEASSRSPRQANEFNVQKPVAPRYVSMYDRIQSFQSWSPSFHQTPEDLAEAGLYYAGTGDDVLCYFCGGGLRGWEPFDEPWREHAKWYPHCQYLLIVKGKAFVEQVLREKDPLCPRSSSNDDEVPSPSKKLRDTAKCQEEPASSDASALLEKDSNNECELEQQVKKSHECDISPKELLKENERLREDQLCRICFENEKQFVLLPCAHFIACGRCAINFSACPVCRTRIEKMIRIYIS